MRWQEWQEALWTFLFPAFCFGCNESVERRGEWCLSCEAKILDVRQLPLNEASSLDELWVIGDYRGVLRERMLEYKFSPYRRKMRFAFWWLLEKAAEKLPFLESKPVVCPIPLHEKRLKERGFNQGEEIFRNWAEKEQRLLWRPLLTRNRATLVQSTIDNKERRRKNIRGAFSFMDGKEMPQLALLVDDITTSGATLEEAAKVLKKSGVIKVIGLALASGAMLPEEEPEMQED